MSTGYRDALRALQMQVVFNDCLASPLILKCIYLCCMVRFHQQRESQSIARYTKSYICNVVELLCLQDSGCYH